MLTEKCGELNLSQASDRCLGYFVLCECSGNASTLPKTVHEEQFAHCRVAGQQLSEAIIAEVDKWLSGIYDKLLELGPDGVLDVLKFCMSGVAMTRKYATLLTLTYRQSPCSYATALLPTCLFNHYLQRSAGVCSSVQMPEGPVALCAGQYLDMGS